MADSYGLSVMVIVLDISVTCQLLIFSSCTNGCMVECRVVIAKL